MCCNIKNYVTQLLKHVLQHLSVFLDHRRVNLYLRVWLGWCARRTQGFILVRRNVPTSSSLLLVLPAFGLQLGLQTGERGKGSQVSGGRSERVLRAQSLLSRVFVSCSCIFISWFGPPLLRRPAFPFISEGKAWVTVEENEKNEREEGFQDRRVLLLLHAGPADPIDVNRGSSTSWPYPSLAPRASVICRSWRSTPSWRTSW